MTDIIDYDYNFFIKCVMSWDLDNLVDQNRKKFEGFEIDRLATLKECAENRIYYSDYDIYFQVESYKHNGETIEVKFVSDMDLQDIIGAQRDVKNKDIEKRIDEALKNDIFWDR